MNDSVFSQRTKLAGIRPASRLAWIAAVALLPLAGQAKESRPAPAEQLAAAVTTPPTPAPVPVVQAPATPQDPAAVAEAAAKIDALVLAGVTKAGQKMNPPASDEQIVRRLYLDIAGRIPTAEETTAFLADTAPDKRAKLIDRLLASDGYNSHMFNWLADTLRVTDDFGKQTKAYLYEQWLKEQIATDRPWDRMVHDMLTAEGRLSHNGAVGYLLRDRGMPLDNLSNTLTVFLGANVACAQCHDHPLAQWKQSDFFEMASFFGATDQGYKKGQKKPKGAPRVNLRELYEKSGYNKGMILSILAPNQADVETLHRNGLTFPKDYKYDNAKPGAPVPPKLMTWTDEDMKNPAFSVDTSKVEQLREQFANWLTHPQNPRFATAISNRLWKRFFGIAVQEPITDLDNLAKASNPQLLEQLTVEMRRVKFDLKEFQRIVLNTQAYQRQASMTPDPAKGPYVFPGPVLRRMTAEQAWDSVLTLVVGSALDEYKLNRTNDVRRLDIPDGITAEKIIAKCKELTEAASKRKKGKFGAGKKGGSGIEVREDDYNGDPPPRFEDLTLARASELAQPAKEAHFLRMFGQSDRQLADDGSTEGGVPQVLMMMNGHVQKCIASSASQVLKHAAAQTTPGAKVKSLYISFLGRAPSDHESQIACKAMANGLSLGDLTWVLFNSREFIFVQ